MRPRRMLVPIVLASAWLVAFGAPSAAAAGSKFANLTGAQEVPGPGDPDGSAAAFFKLEPAAGQVCVAQRHENIDLPTAMHIHRGAAGVGGPVVVNLTPTLSGPACVVSTTALVREINTSPEGFYINIHNGSFSAGAVRGQLDTSLVSSAMPTTSGPTHLFGRMDGAQEVPGPGDPDGRGSVLVDLKRAAGQVCVDERYAGIAAPAAMHIHDGDAGVAGPIVVDLSPALSGSTRCVAAAPATIRQIKLDPAGFYCNLHNSAFSAGAIRGQLEPST